MQTVLHGGSLTRSKESRFLSDIKPALSLFSIPYPAGQPIRTLYSQLAVDLRLLSSSYTSFGIGMASSGAADSLVQRFEELHDQILDDSCAGNVCRSCRLVITAVRDPASANSVQLAKLDLYIQLDPSPQPTPSLLGSVHQLQTAASLAGAGSGSAVLESIGTLLRVLCNIVQHPAESKHRTLRMENAKIKAMLSGHSEVSNLLSIIGTLHSLPHIIAN